VRFGPFRELHRPSCPSTFPSTAVPRSSTARCSGSKHSMETERRTIVGTPTRRGWRPAMNVAASTQREFLCARSSAVVPVRSPAARKPTIGPSSKTCAVGAASVPTWDLVHCWWPFPNLDVLAPNLRMFAASLLERWGLRANGRSGGVPRTRSRGTSAVCERACARSPARVQNRTLPRSTSTLTTRRLVVRWMLGRGKSRTLPSIGTPTTSLGHCRGALRRMRGSPLPTSRTQCVQCTSIGSSWSEPRRALTPALGGG